jgi:molybdopterin-containing oxidoreductase family iron-sulfur binding subunit
MSDHQDTRPEHWRSLDHLEGGGAFRLVRAEEERNAQPVVFTQVTRRNFLGLMGAATALASLSGCRKPVEKIVPYVTQPEEVTPGVPSVYATTMPFGASATGLLVSCREGRPIKIEGNPDHPASRGATDALTQAAILDLYDPDRSKGVLQNGAEKSWADFVAFWRTLADSFGPAGGRGLAVLSEPFASPTLMRLRDLFLKRYPQATWVAWEPIGDETILEAARNVAGRAVRPVHRIDRASVIAAFDSDFLYAESEHVAAARDFASGRRTKGPGDSMNRLYALESGFTVTGAAADHRLRIASGQVGPYLLALATLLSRRGVALPGIGEHRCADEHARWLEALADDIAAAGPGALIVAGRRQPVWVHELVYLVNSALGATGNTLVFVPADGALAPSTTELNGLLRRADAGEIDTLVMFGGNPVHELPDEAPRAFKGVRHTIHFHEFVNETGAASEWHVPRAHFLESWGDAEAFDGTRSVIQPTIEPLHAGKMEAEFLALLADGLDRSGYEIVRETWQPALSGADFEKQWRRVVHDGYLAGGAAVPVEFKMRMSPGDVAGRANLPELPAARALEVNLYPSGLWDGRFANNAWLQEIPDPVTRLSWSNVAQVSVRTARELGLKSSEIVKIQIDGRSIEAPLWITPGHADRCVSLSLGYGRTHAGEVGNGVGVDAYRLRRLDLPWILPGAVLTGTGRMVELANTQDHGVMEGRPIVREATLAHYREHPQFAKEAVEHPPLKSIYPDHDYSEGYQWGMVIDLSTCIGCNACAVACQSENNVPTVGFEQVRNGREMHWIRNDRYFVGDAEDPRIVFQPVTCQHCENAPCEEVCPVAATVHDHEGLNTMNYNRCIGTRYCSNNCPYKVRRFNFFNYVHEMPDLVQMAMNPDVTVRARGVMEKCSFCLQRINRAKGEAKREGRTLRDGELVTACEQVCPAEAIRFGNINDPGSRVVKLKAQDKNYELLAELNVRPRNSYLARIRNPNPAIEPAARPDEAGEPEASA